MPGATSWSDSSSAHRRTGARWSGSEVGDGSSLLPTVHHFTVASTSGRGLHLVESLSAAWGVELAEGRSGKTVWAELEIDADNLPTSFNLDDVDPL